MEEHDPVYEKFVTTRAHLLEEAAHGRNALTEWIERHRTLNASLPELAQLEGLLVTRRTVLERLMKLDDELLDHLLARRKGMQAKPASDAVS